MFQIEGKSIFGCNRVISTSPIKAHQIIYKSTNYLIFSRPTYQTVQVNETDHILDIVFANMNHSCQPSTYIDCKTLTLSAEKDIEIGEELTFFYPSTEWEIQMKFKCNCKSPSCLDVICGTVNNHIQGNRINQHIKILWEKQNLLEK